MASHLHFNEVLPSGKTNTPGHFTAKTRLKLSDTGNEILLKFGPEDANDEDLVAVALTAAQVKLLRAGLSYALDNTGDA